MTYSVDTGQPLSQPLLSLPSGFMNKVDMLAGIEAMHGLLINMDFHSPRLALLWPLLSAQSASSKDQH